MGIKLKAINNATNLVNKPRIIKIEIITWNIANNITAVIGCIGINEGTRDDHTSGSKMLVIPNHNKVNPNPNLKINEL